MSVVHLGHVEFIGLLNVAIRSGYGDDYDYDDVRYRIYLQRERLSSI